MQVPVQVSFQDMPVSDAVEAHCWAEAEKLALIDDRITGCRIVVVESTRPATGRSAFRVRVELNVPGAVIVVQREPPEGRDDDIRTAVRETFRRTRRQLAAEAHVRSTQ